MRQAKQAKTILPRARVEARLGYALAGVIGYILSPASWWNDALVNIPLSLLMAKVLQVLFNIPVDLGFTAAYWASNILGVLLMAIGFQGARGKSLNLRETLLGVAFATVYTLAVVGLLNIID